MNDTIFIGIDLAWSDKNSSGVAVFKGGQTQTQLVDSKLVSSAEVFAYIRRFTGEPTIVAIDAPLVIVNQSGQRACEKLIGRKYGARHASCHSSNLSRSPYHPGPRLASQLESIGFRHAPNVDLAKAKRAMLEVYPHPAMLELFHLETIIRYKKGKVKVKRNGQTEVQRRLRELLTTQLLSESGSCLQEVLRVKTTQLTGARLKENEDRLDAILCAYIAYHCWRWGRDGFTQYGDVESRYIIVPEPPSALPPQNIEP